MNLEVKDLEAEYVGVPGLWIFFSPVGYLPGHPYGFGAKELTLS